MGQFMTDDEVKLAPELPPEFTPGHKLEIRGATLSDSRVGISVVNPVDGRPAEFWLDLPNAMYLMNLLNGIWIKTRTRVPVHAPPGRGREEAPA